MRTRAGWVVTAATTMALAILAPAAARAAVSFERTDYAVGGGATSLAVGDIDGRDGADLVAVTYPTGGIVRRLNDGHGHFGPALTTAICPAAQVELADITTGGTDFTPDGKLDAVVFCTDSGAIARMAGDGAGGFGAPHASIGLNSPPYVGDHFALGDITDYARVKLLMYHTQDGAFAGVACALYDYVSDLACLDPHGVGGEMQTADLGGDGHEELVMLGGAKGLMAFGITPPFGSTPRSWTSVGIAFGKGQSESGNHVFAFGDLHADGRIDVATSWSTSSQGWVSTVDAQPVSLSSSAAREFPSIAGIHKIVTGDFDADGRVDVLAASEYGRAAVHAGDGLGGLGAPQEVPLIGYGDPAKATVVDAATADVDRNGTADAVVLDELIGQFEVLRNLAPPLAPAPPGGGPGPAPVPPVTPPAPVGPKPGGTLDPLRGLTKLVSSLTIPKRGTITLGQAANPPTRRVTITLTVPGATSAAKRAKPLTIARATVTIPAGQKRPLTVRLTARGRALSRGHARLKATATFVATATDGTAKTRKRTVTLRRRAAKH
jgi:hypothetical protein